MYKSAFILASAWVWFLVGFQAGPALGFAITFDSLAQQELFDSTQATVQDPAASTFDCPDCPFDILNNSGRTWTDFHMTLALGPVSAGAAQFVPFVVNGFDGDVYEGPGTDVLDAPGGFFGQLEVRGLSIPHATVYGFNVDLAGFIQGGSYKLFGFPTVPEPATLALFGAGLAGLGWMRRRRRRRPPT